MTDRSSPSRQWILVRSTGLIPEEEGVLAALAIEAVKEGAELVTVLLGTAAYDAERSSRRLPSDSGPVWVLEEDVEGRGVWPRAMETVRRVSPDELVQGIMSAEKVISFS